ncbi:hypothetical protein D3C84_1198000 [compost metagenome]
MELNTKNGSEVIARIAGTLSTANKTSITSITIKATNNGVAALFAVFVGMKNFSPSVSDVIGIIFPNVLYTKESFG